MSSWILCPTSSIRAVSGRKLNIPCCFGQLFSYSLRFSRLTLFRLVINPSLAQIQPSHGVCSRPRLSPAYDHACVDYFSIHLFEANHVCDRASCVLNSNAAPNCMHSQGQRWQACFKLSSKLLSRSICCEIQIAGPWYPMAASWNPSAPQRQIFVVFFCDVPIWSPLLYSMVENTLR